MSRKDDSVNINPVVKINQRFDEGHDCHLMVKGSDHYIYDTNGKRYIDFCSGIWNVPFGYSNKQIDQRINEQMDRLQFCNLVMNTAEIQEEYASLINKELGTTGFLYTCSGSESIEAAIKTCRKYQSMKKNNRKGISAFNLSYHGTTYGAMSVSGVDKKASEDYFPLIDAIKWIELPTCLEDEELWLAIIEEHFEKHWEEMAGIIIELVLGSGGIIEVPKLVVKRIAKLCEKYDVLMVVDEVTTGFGRTGVPFAFKEYEIEPDLICLSKGITNGYLPLGGLAFSRKVSETFVENHEMLEHFSTQGGNLLSIAAAKGVLELMEDYESYEVHRKGEVFKEYLSSQFSKDDGVKVRGKGLMLALELSENLRKEQLLNLWQQLKKRGILVYLFSNPGYNQGFSFFPPFTCTDDDLIKTAKNIGSLVKRHADVLVR